MCSGKDQKYTSGWCSSILHPLHPSSSVAGGTELNLKEAESNQCKGVLTLFMLHSRRDVLNPKQNGKKTYRLGKNICKSCDWQGLHVQNIQMVHKTQW